MSLMFTEDAEARKTCLIPKKIAKLLVIKITLLILTLFLELWTYVALTLIQAHVACQSPCLASIRRPNDVKSSFMEVHISFHFLLLILIPYFFQLNPWGLVFLEGLKSALYWNEGYIRMRVAVY